MTNLLYTITSYPPSTGGAQLYLHMLASNLIATHDVQVVCQWTNNRTDWLLGTTLLAPAQDRDYTIDGVNVHQYGMSIQEKCRLLLPVLGYYPLMGLALPEISAPIQKHLQYYAANRELVHNVRFGREGLSYASLAIARAQGIPFVFTPVHHPRWVGWRYEAYIRLYQQADVVLALTNAEKATLVELGVKSDSIVVTGMGPNLAATANPQAFRQKHQIEGPIVLFIGQHYTYKGYQQLLAAAPLVWRYVPEAHFVFIGPPVGNSENSYRAYTDRRIHRLGKVSLQEKTDSLAACTLLCVPSTQESFGAVYTEAWSFGRPVIGCDIPAVAEVITDEIDGCLVKQEAQQIADRICYLLLHPDKADQMGVAGKQQVDRQYTWSRIAAKTEAAYRTVL
ncbi:MAG: glycosyltransferase family 4 protein [Caldilineaceae bacterium]